MENIEKVSIYQLRRCYKKTESYIAATLMYIGDVLGIEVDEFKTSDLPDEWLALLKKEAYETNRASREEPSISDLAK